MDYRQASKKHAELTSTKKLVQNSLITILAKVFPLLVGILTLPYLIRELGDGNFGILAIIWLLIEYFSRFDLGVGRAVIKQLSDLIEKGDQKEFSQAAWTGIIFIFLMGLVSGLVLYFSGEIILDRVFNSKDLEILDLIIYTSYAVPFIIASTGFRSILMAEQKFTIISIIQSINSLLNYALPLFLLYYLSFSFKNIVVSLLFLRGLSFFVYAISCLAIIPELRKGVHFSRRYASSMISFGKWVTISSLLGPLMGQLDRYFIASFISVSAVTFYTTPLEVLGRSMMIPMAIITVLFPAFSSLSNTHTSKRETLLYESTKIVMLTLFPIFLIISTFANQGLMIWLGDEFALKSTLIAQIFCIIFFLRGLSYIPITFLPSMNRPELPAIFHTVEFILFVVGLLWATKSGSIVSVAYVSLARAILDFLLLFVSSLKLVQQKQREMKSIIWQSVSGAVILSLMPVFQSVTLRVTFMGVIMVIGVFYFWFYLKEMFKKITSQFVE